MLFEFWLRNQRRLRPESLWSGVGGGQSAVNYRVAEGAQASTRVRPVQGSRGLGVHVAQGQKQSGAWRKLCDTAGWLRQPANEGRYQHDPQLGNRTASLFVVDWGDAGRHVSLNPRALEQVPRHQADRVLCIPLGPSKRCSTWAEIMTAGYFSKRIEGQTVIVNYSFWTQQLRGEKSLPATL